MITLRQIQKEYGATLRKQSIMRQWIDNPECQEFIKKAFNKKLTENEIDYIFKIGNWKGRFPGLYYLTTIYMHPLTYLQGAIQKYERLAK